MSCFSKYSTRCLGNVFVKCMLALVAYCDSLVISRLFCNVEQSSGTSHRACSYHDGTSLRKSKLIPDWWVWNVCMNSGSSKLPRFGPPPSTGWFLSSHKRMMYQAIPWIFLPTLCLHYGLHCNVSTCSIFDWHIYNQFTLSVEKRNRY